MPTAEQLFERAGHLIVELCQRYYEQDDESVLPRNIASFAAFENAMCLDIAMGGSTNTILHLLAAAQEAELDFTMADIDRLSRKVPQLCKVAPNTPKYHMEDVHRAGGIMGILGELDRAGLLHSECPTVHSTIHGRRAGAMGHHAQRRSRDAQTVFCRPCRHPHPGSVQPGHALASLDEDRESRLYPFDSNMPTPAMAAWPSCSAISPRTAAW